MATPAPRPRAYLTKPPGRFFDNGDPAAEELGRRPGPARSCTARPAQVAAGIRRRATTYGYPPAKGEKARTTLRPLPRRQDSPTWTTPPPWRTGWPIATGIIEGACRHIVNGPHGHNGRTMGPGGAEAILRLRAIIASGDFDAYWHYHLRREHERIHHARYRESLILAA